MSHNVDIQIGHRSYKMVVEIDQEARLQKVAAEFDKRIQALRAASGDMERDRLLVLAAMMLSDELLTLKTEKDQQEESIAAFNNTLAKRLDALCD